jgi:uncharacterized membrane-anchored protein
MVHSSSIRRNAMAMPSASDAKQMLEKCGDYMERLTAWEQNFIESVTDQVGRKGTISEKQYEILDRIYQKVP